MLQISKPRPLADSGVATPELISPAELYAVVIGFARRRFPVVAFTVVLILALAIIYIVTTPPKFTGHAVLMIDTHKTQFFQQQQSPLGDLPIDSAAVDTQIEILNSENIALSVVKQLHLDQDPEFIYPRAGISQTVLGFVMRLDKSGHTV